MICQVFFFSTTFFVSHQKILLNKINNMHTQNAQSNDNVYLKFWRRTSKKKIINLFFIFYDHFTTNCLQRTYIIDRVLQLRNFIFYSLFTHDIPMMTIIYVFETNSYIQFSSVSVISIVIALIWSFFVERRTHMMCMH